MDTAPNLISELDLDMVGLNERAKYLGHVSFRSKSKIISRTHIQSAHCSTWITKVVNKKQNKKLCNDC